MIDIVFLIILLIGLCVTVCIGALIAWLCGCNVNEPEYYAHKRKRK